MENVPEIETEQLLRRPGRHRLQQVGGADAQKVCQGEIVTQDHVNYTEIVNGEHSITQIVCKVQLYTQLCVCLLCLIFVMQSCCFLLSWSS